MNELIDILDNQNASLVIRDAQGAIHTLHGRGVSDLHNILHNMPQWLNGAMVADKVVGRGAAALMILGRFVIDTLLTIVVFVSFIRTMLVLQKQEIVGSDCHRASL